VLQLKSVERPKLHIDSAFTLWSIIYLSSLFYSAVVGLIIVSKHRINYSNMERFGFISYLILCKFFII